MKILFTLLIAVFTLQSAFAQTEQNIKSGDNNIHLKTFGEGEPILIINGGPGMNSNGFAALAEVLGKSNKAILYDQRGTGLSAINSVDSNTITLDLMVEDIETIRKHLKIKKWVVLGHSFGGMLASQYASKYPDRIKGLIYSSSGGIDLELFKTLRITSKLSQELQDSLSYWSKRIGDGDTTYFAKLQRGKILAPLYLYDQSHVNTIAHRMTQANYTINGLVFNNMFKIDFDCKKALSTFSKPVLIIQGEQDVVPKNIAEKADNVFSNSEIVIMPKCGHYGWLDQPEIYFKKIDKFLKSLEG
jgi:proline iminopeptidase